MILYLRITYDSMNLTKPARADCRNNGKKLVVPDESANRDAILLLHYIEELLTK
jgi:hypothetical protein